MIPAIQTPFEKGIEGDFTIAAINFPRPSLVKRRLICACEDIREYGLSWQPQN
jgi:hypothetical protein